MPSMHLQTHLLNDNYVQTMANPLQSTIYQQQLHPHQVYSSQNNMGFPINTINSNYSHQMQHQNSVSSQQNSPRKAKDADLKPLHVIIVPMETNCEVYPMELKIKGNETSLKQVFDENVNNYWTRVFKGHSPKEPPSYSVFRKAMNIETEYCPEFQGKSLHILLLKCEGYKFPRNPNAHFLELFCNTHFYGPLVVAMNMNIVPYHLSNFKTELLKEIYKINEAEKRQYPPPFVPTNSQKKNKSMPFYVSNESKGDFSEDLGSLKMSMDQEMFYMYRYKTAYCPQKNIKHDWSSCIYAHRPQDFRRPPDQYAYVPDDCKNQSVDSEECPLGFKCKFSHNTYERLYHPLKYKTNPCDQSFKNKKKNCKRGSICAFYHEKMAKRQPHNCNKCQPYFKIAGQNYSQQIPKTLSPMNSSIMVTGQMQNMSPIVIHHQLPYSPQNSQQVSHFLQHESPMVYNNGNNFLMNSQKQNPYRIERTLSFTENENEALTQQNSIFMDFNKPHSFSPQNNILNSNTQNRAFTKSPFPENNSFSSNLNPESFQSLTGSLDQQSKFKTTNENAFSSYRGLPYFGGMQFNIKDEEGSSDNDDMELHIDEDLSNSILAHIYSKNPSDKANFSKEVGTPKVNQFSLALATQEGEGDQRKEIL